MLGQLEFLCFMIIKYHRLSYLTFFRARLMSAVHTGVIINSGAKRALGTYLSAAWQSWCVRAPGLEAFLGAI